MRENEMEPAIGRSDVWALIAVAVLVLVVYLPLLSGQAVMPDTWERFEPWNTELGFNGPLDPRIASANNDAILLYIPWNKFAHDELNAGRIPAWDPNCLWGVPLASNHLVPVFYPIYWIIVRFFPALYVLGISGMIHTLILGFFFYLFLKEWVGNRPAAWLAASALVVSMLPNPHYQPWPMTLAWFPAIWFFYERWLKHRSAWAGLWMALCWAGPLLAGYPSLFVQLSLFTLVWILVRPLMMKVETRPKFVGTLLILVWPLLLGIALSAVQNVPTIMAARESDRTIFKTADQLAQEAEFTVPPNEPWQMHVKRLLQPLVPFRFPGNDLFNRGYLGVIPVLFALFGLGWLTRKDYPRVVALLALLVAPFALIPALNFAIYRLTKGVLIDPNPPIEVFGLLVLMLAAVGVKLWFETRSSKKSGKQVWFGVVLAAIAALGAILVAMKVGGNSLLFGRFGVALTGLLAVLLIVQIFRARKTWQYQFTVLVLFVILATNGGMLASILSPEQGASGYLGKPMPQTDAINSLKNLANPSAGGKWGRVVRYFDGPVDVMSMTDQPYTFYPNLGTYFGVPDIFGYHNLAPSQRFDYLRMIQKDAVIEERGIVAFNAGVDLKDPNLGVIGARYVLSDKTIPGLKRVGGFPGFYVSEIESSSISGRLELVEGSGEQRKPVLVRDQPGRIVAESDQNSESVLVLNEGYAKGWEARIDNEKAALRPTDDARMAVEVPSGKHTVELRYVMPGLKAGWGVTAAGWFVWLIVAISLAIVRRKVVE